MSQTNFAVEVRSPNGIWTFLFWADRPNAAAHVARLRADGHQARYRYESAEPKARKAPKRIDVQAALSARRAG